MVTLPTLPTSRPFPKSGPFPPPTLLGFLGTTSLSATPHGRTWPSRECRWKANLSTAGVSRVALVTSSCACCRHYSGRTRDRCRSVVPWRRPSPLGRRVGSCETRFRSLLDVHGLPKTLNRQALVTARTIAESPVATLFHPRLPMASLPPPPLGLLPAGTTSCRVGFAPTDDQHLRTAHAPTGRNMLAQGNALGKRHQIRDK